MTDEKNNTGLEEIVGSHKKDEIIKMFESIDKNLTQNALYPKGYTFGQGLFPSEIEKYVQHDMKVYSHKDFDIVVALHDREHWTKAGGGFQTTRYYSALYKSKGSGSIAQLNGSSVIIRDRYDGSKDRDDLRCYQNIVAEIVDECNFTVAIADPKGNKMMMRTYSLEQTKKEDGQK